MLEARLGTSIAGTQAAIGSDNTPTVAWSTRMASRSGSPISFRLLRGLAMRQRVNRSAPTAVFHVAGLQNILADVASRPVTGVASHYHLYERDPNAMCPQSFLTHFNTSLLNLPRNYFRVTLNDLTRLRRLRPSAKASCSSFPWSFHYLPIN